ncbi:hypothetical protein LLG10_06845 [bacterium]|nr:hypothetical protein [bacterium]
MNKPSQNDWIEAIAERIVDEWDGKTHFPEDSQILRNFLLIALKMNSEWIEKFIGTGFIEDSYFDQLE